MDNEDVLSSELENENDEIDYEAKIAEINAALERNSNKMAEIEKALTEIDARKIFTLKELREMEKQKQREAEEKLENEKRMIDLITAEALKKAEDLRKNAVTEGEKVKAEEQGLAADVQKYYGQAKEASAAFPGLDLRMKAMEKKVFELQTASAKIQEMAYKPFIQRIKDYLMGLACVAILLMGLNLLKSKLALVKQARDQAKKLKGLTGGQHNYPTI